MARLSCRISGSSGGGKNPAQCRLHTQLIAAAAALEGSLHEEDKEDWYLVCSTTVCKNASSFHSMCYFVRKGRTLSH